MKRVAVLALVAVSAAVSGCRSTESKDYEMALPPGQMALRKITDPKQIPDFTPGLSNTAGLRESMECSLNYLRKPSSEKVYPYGQVTHEQAVATLKAFVELLDLGLTPAQTNALMRERFDVYVSVGCDNKGTVLYTGYYTPIFEASPVETARFKYPLYKAPSDLVKLPDGSPSVPMPDRREIEETKKYRGNELVWLGDAFEAYAAHIEGSVKLRMPDGLEATVGYAANNGHEYKSVRAEMVKDGKIEKRAGLPAMTAYFKAHPNDVDKYVWRNPRYVFFAPVADGRPRGCLNEPVTTRRTIATDKKIYPPAALTFVATSLPEHRGAAVVDVPYAGFALDQDAGGAIRAAGRCDIYLGVGKEAGELAGRAQNEGRLYYLFIKPGKMPPPIVPSTSTMDKAAKP